MKLCNGKRGLLLALYGITALLGVYDQRPVGAAVAVASGSDRPSRATHSSPIAITSDNEFVWSVNPDNNSVSVFHVAGDANQKVAEISVDKEPWCVTRRCTSRIWPAAPCPSSTLTNAR